MTTEARRRYKAAWTVRDRQRRLEEESTGSRPRLGVVVGVSPDGDVVECATATGRIVRATARPGDPLRCDDVVRLTWRKVKANERPGGAESTLVRAGFAAAIAEWEAETVAHCMNAAYEHIHGPGHDGRRKAQFNTLFADLFRYTTDREKELMARARGHSEQWQFPNRGPIADRTPVRPAGGRRVVTTRCPECGGGRLGTLEKIGGVAWIGDVGDKGIEYDGYTDVLWDESETQTDAQGRPLLHCGDCAHEWYETPV